MDLPPMLRDVSYTNVSSTQQGASVLRNGRGMENTRSIRTTPQLNALKTIFNTYL